MKPRTDEQMRLFLEGNSEKVTESGCWLWMGGLDKDGYGQTHYQGRNVRAHRAAYLLFKGPVTSGLVVMHRCDIPACINPDHLGLGTNAENTEDRTKKGRHRAASGDSHYMRRNPLLRSGSNAPAARLNEMAVLEILRLHSSGITQENLAKKFGITRSGVSAITTRRTWKHINQPEHTN